eukprot:UN32333
MENNFWSEIDKGKKAGVLEVAKLVEKKCNPNCIRNGKRALDLMLECQNKSMAEYLHQQGAQFTSHGVEQFINRLEEGDLRAVHLYFECGLVLGPKKGGAALIRAVKNQHKEIIDLLIQQKADLNVTNYAEGSALICAISADQTDIMMTLLDAKADVNTPSPWGGTAMTQAVTLGSFKIFTVLQKVGAELNVKDKNGT